MRESWVGMISVMQNGGRFGEGGFLGLWLRAECLRCLGVGYELENLEVNEVVWMGVRG